MGYIKGAYVDTWPMSLAPTNGAFMVKWEKTSGEEKIIKGYLSVRVV